MPDKGIDFTVAFTEDISALYATDEMEDFIGRDRLIDLSRANPEQSFELIRNAIEDREIGLVVQVGATPLYACLPRWKESIPEIRIADVLYNQVGHTLNHFLYERCIDAVIVESDAMRRYVRRASAKAHPSVEVVRSGVDVGSLTPRDRPYVGDAPLTVGYIGRMSKEKNPLGFIDMAEQLLVLDPDLDFRMAGTGPEAKEVEDRLRGSPYRDRILYSGFVDSLSSELHEIDVLVLSSRFDGRPVIVMEASACGVPVVAAPVGGVPELIDEGVNGYLVHPEDIGPIHDLLSTWKRSPETLMQLGRSAREYACRMFARERMMDDYARAFRRLAAPSDTTAAAG
jgi:glycosyltransferase involved in cell wall biosynthesis